MTLVTFVLGMIIGIAFGFIVCSVLTASRQEDEISKRTLKSEETDNTTNH